MAVIFKNTKTTLSCMCGRVAYSDILFSIFHLDLVWLDRCFNNIELHINYPLIVYLFIYLNISSPEPKAHKVSL